MLSTYCCISTRITLHRRCAVYRSNTSWGLIDAPTLELLLRSDDLVCNSEMDVFEALLKWSAKQARKVILPSAVAHSSPIVLHTAAMRSLAASTPAIPL